MHGQLRYVRYIAVWCYLGFLFLPFSFSEVETASEMTKTMGVLPTHVSEYRISELC